MSPVLSLLQAYLASDRLPKETLSGFKWAFLPQLKIVPFRKRAEDQDQFHFCNIAAYAPSRAKGEWNEASSL